MFIIIVLCILLAGSDAVIYSLTDSEYARMPPLIHLDPYEACQRDADALYCMSEYALVSDKPSPLLDMIQEFSAHKVTHFNHTHLHYGICVTQTCKTFYNNFTDQRLTLEACLNDSMTDRYDLKVRLIGNPQCRKPGVSPNNIDQWDLIVGIICIVILIANIVGSIFDYYCDKKQQDGALRFLICFSLLHNWKKLRSTNNYYTDPRLKSLKSFHGIRTISVGLVIIVHSLLIVTISPNPEFIEEVYKQGPYHVLLNGPLIMQTFLIISSFLLVYNLLLYYEKHVISWSMLPRAIASRWLRLTPPYAIVLALTATWFAHVSSGPLWDRYVELEMKNCRQYWWRHILYINNYFEDSECMVQSWYLATDMQLYCLCVIVFLACRTSLARKITLSLLFIIGMIIPAAHVFFEDLDGVLIVSPKALVDLFITDPHFNKIYIRSHTNITGYVIGMAMAYIVYNWQNKKIDVKKYQNLIYRILYWSTFPLGVCCCYIGIIFYNDGPRQPLYVRVLFALFIKAVFGILMAVMFIGFCFKFEGLYRGVLEWRAWKLGSRLSYSAYLVHIALTRNYVGMQTSLRRNGVMLGVEVGVTLVTGTFIAALFFWLLVEAPLSNVTKQCLSKQTIEQKKRKKKSSTTDTETFNNSVNAN